MKKRKIGIIGHFGGNNSFTDGQTVKTKEIYNYLVKNTSYNIEKVDTYKMKFKFIKKLKEIYNLMNNSDVIILIVSSRGYKILVPIINVINKNKKIRLYDFVIGGNRQKIYKNNIYLLNCAKKYRKIYVETEKIQQEYKKYGFDNVEVISNFKSIDAYKPKSYKKKKNKIKFCTFSRVCREKGISVAIETIKKLNSKDTKHTYYLDIYGNVEKSYEAEFEKKIKENSDYISYCGIVPFSDSSKVISTYDILLFLTFWPGEGFPGTLIDCFFASTPVIATDWNYNFEILEENKTGIKVNVDKIDDIVDEILYLVNNLNILEKMSLNCYNERKKYMPSNIIKPLINDLEVNNGKEK